MTTSLIEQCFTFDDIEEQHIVIPTGKTLLVIDPYMLNIDDITRQLVKAQPGSLLLLRARRPLWGRGDLHKYIHVIRL